jgi:hypothetical protein
MRLMRLMRRRKRSERAQMLPVAKVQLQIGLLQVVSHGFAQSHPDQRRMRGRSHIRVEAHADAEVADERRACTDDRGHDQWQAP